LNKLAVWDNCWLASSFFLNTTVIFILFPWNTKQISMSRNELKNSLKHVGNNLIIQHIYKQTWFIRNRYNLEKKPSDLKTYHIRWFPEEMLRLPEDLRNLSYRKYDLQSIFTPAVKITSSYSSLFMGIVIDYLKNLQCALSRLLP
jgi:hypothetical protein